ncbi:MAG: DNA polymerase I [Actinomycetes bacterium]
MSQKNSNDKKLLLIDGHSMAYRAFYALPVDNFKSSSGQPTNAIYGFASMIINLIKEEKPTHIAVAFDVSRKTFRTEKFPEYKAQRAATPDEFRSQMSHINELITGFGIKYFALEGYEADDIIATLAKAAEKKGFAVSICTGDRDSFQLVNNQTTVLYPKKGVTEMSRMTPDAVFEKYGLTPQQYPDFAALRGDPSDNLPSVPGVGEKTATKWIVDYKNLENLLEHASEIPGKVGESLRANIDAIKLNRVLTHLLDDVEIPTEIEDLNWEGFDAQAVNKLFDLLEIKALKERIKVLQQSGSSEPVVAKKEVSIKELSSIEISKLVGKSTEPIALYFEFNDERLVNYAIAFEDQLIYRASDNKIGDWITDPKVKKIVHGAKQPIKNLGLLGLGSDIEILAYLNNPGSRNLELNDLAQRLIGATVEQDGLFPDFNPEAAGWIHQINKILLAELTDKGMVDLYLDLELPTLIALAKLEKVGIAVDQKKLQKLSDDFASIVAEETKGAYKAAGHEFNVASPKQLQAVLFDELKLPKTKKIKTGFTTDAESLQWLLMKTRHPILQHLMRIRETSKLQTTIDGLLAAISKDGRIHTSFQQTVAATGRLSSTEPNLQNIPVRTEEGREIRNCFIAQKPFTELLTADYSQIEMRIMAHLSNDQGLIAAFESGEDLHSTVGAQVFGVQPNEVDAEMRRTIKAMSYGLAYGLSAFGLSQQLDIDPTEAGELMNKYFQRFGGIRDYLKSVVVEAREKGYTETILGRRRYLPDLNHENRMRREIAERAALNAPIQGSAADIIKIALLKVNHEIEKEALKSRALLQVHDELIFEVMPGERDKLEAIVKKQMSEAFKLRVPLDVNIGFGASWDTAAH